ncbi:MAG: hypothetical protein SFX19_08565 [Alphaproteobacteria bacterium]|nr:hypothetical protein [Alphaproteobacteria bacterium]
MKHLILVAFTITSIASSAWADDSEVKGQNALTRAIVEPLSGILTPVPNPKTTPCYSAVDCREKGRDLITVWQVNHTTDFGPKDYPQRCYIPGENGKYVYSAAAC